MKLLNFWSIWATILVTIALVACLSFVKGLPAEDWAFQRYRAHLGREPTPLALQFNSDETLPRLPIGWNSCGHDSDQFKLEVFTLDPDPPKRSRQLRIRVKGHLKEPLDGGRLNYTVHYGIIPIVQDSLPLCEALQMEPKLPQCPLRKGDWNVEHVAEMPAEVPFGRYTISAASWDLQGRQIFCLRGCTTISLRSKALESGIESDVDSDQEGDAKSSKIELFGDRQVKFTDT